MHLVISSCSITSTSCYHSCRISNSLSCLTSFHHSPDFYSHDSCLSLAFIATFIAAASPVTGPHYSCLTEFHLSCFYSFYISFLAAGAPAASPAPNIAASPEALASPASMTAASQAPITAASASFNLAVYLIIAVSTPNPSSHPSCLVL